MNVRREKLGLSGMAIKRIAARQEAQVSEDDARNVLIGPHIWDMAERCRAYMSDEEFIEALLRAMDQESAQENLEFILRRWEIPAEGEEDTLADWR